MSSQRILVTKNYRLFQRHSGENRPLDMAKHRALLNSMKLYGFLRCFPIVAHREKDGVLVVKDGQHRLAIAEELGLPVYWVDEDTDFDVAVVNSAAKGWALADYAAKYIANGKTAYLEGMEFHRQHKLPVGTAFSLLAGTTTFANCKEQFLSGDFKVKDRAWASAVAGVYGPLVEMAPAMKNARFIEACMAVCRVEDFEPQRLITNAGRCREKLVAFATREAYLDMLEAIYNFGRSRLVGLKASATMAMRERSVAVPKNGKKPSKAEACAV